jgi:hypothetical protein
MKFPVRFVEISADNSIYDLQEAFIYEFEDAATHDGTDYGTYDAQIGEMILWCTEHLGTEGDAWRQEGWCFFIWDEEKSKLFASRWC